MSTWALAFLGWLQQFIGRRPLGSEAQNGAQDLPDLPFWGWLAGPILWAMIVLVVDGC